MIKGRIFVKWAGGKRQIIDKLKQYVPNEFNTYYEPVISGGALFFELSPKKAVINDYNKELIRVFKDVDLIENIDSGVLRILDAYDKSCFKFMDRFLRVSFKYRENPFEYDDNTPKNGVINGGINDAKNINENEQIILNIISENPNILQKEISYKSKIPYRTVQRVISTLKSKNTIERIGSNKKGYWNILK